MLSSLFSIPWQSYITEAVSRFFRSESTNISENELVSHQQRENFTPNTTWHTEHDGDRGEVKEEHALASVCQLSSSRPIVAWETCVTDADIQAHEVDSQYKTKQGKDEEIEESQRAQDSTQHKFSQVVDKDARLVTADIVGKRECEDKMLCSNRRIDEAQDGNEVLQTVNTKLTHDVMTVDLERDGSAKSEEAPAEDVAQREVENLLESTDAEEKDEKNLGDLTGQDDKVDQNMAATLIIDKDLNAITEDKILLDFIEETPAQHDNFNGADADLFFESGNDGPRQGGNELVSNEKLPEQVQDQSIPETELNSETERKMEDVTERKNAMELKDTELALEENQSLSVVNNNEKISIPELQVVECSDAEQVDVRTFSEVQTERKSVIKLEASDEEEGEKSDLDTTDNEVEKECVDGVQTEEAEACGNLCIDDKPSMDATCMCPSINPNLEGERLKETGGQFKNISSWVCEGQHIVLQESPLCEEVTGGVPEHNNEPGGDENTTQRFLEEQDSTETSTIELPQEVESAHSSVSSHDTDLLPVQERVGEEQDSLGDILCDISLDVAEIIGGPCLNEEESQRNVEMPLGEQEIPEVPAGSWKAEDTCLVLAGESHPTDSTTKKQLDETEVLSYETQMDDLKEADAAGCEESTDTSAADKVVKFADEISRALEAEVQKMAEMSFPKEFGSADNLEKSSCSVPTLQEEPYQSIFPENSAEIVLFEESGNDFHIVETEETEQMAKANYTAEEDMQEDKLERKKSQQRIDIATEWDEKLEILYAESETVETQDQLWDEAQGINSEEGEVEFETKKKNAMPTEEMNIGEKRSEDQLAEFNVIDDEILDLWIQTTLTEDTDERPVDEEISMFFEDTNKRPADKEISMFLEDTDEGPVDEEVPTFLEDTDERAADKEVFTFLEVTDERPVDEQVNMFLEDTDEYAADKEVSKFLEGNDERPANEEGPQSGEQVDEEIKLQKEEPCEISTVLTEQNEEPLVEFSSGDFNFANNVETLPATVQSSSLNLEPITSTEKDLMDEVYTPQPADPSELSLLLPDSGSEDAVRVMTPEKGQAYMGEVESLTGDERHPDSGLNSPTRLLNEDQEETDEKTAEEGRSEMTIVYVDDVDFHLTKPNPSCSVVDRAVEDEHLSDSLDEIEQPESGECESSSEASQEDKAPDIESALPEWSDGEFLSGSSRTDVEEEITPEFGDLMEVLFILFENNFIFKIYYNF